MASPPPPARVTVRRSSRVSDSNTIFGSYPTRRSTWRQKPSSTRTNDDSCLVALKYQDQADSRRTRLLGGLRIISGICQGTSVRTMTSVIQEARPRSTLRLVGSVARVLFLSEQGSFFDKNPDYSNQQGSFFDTNPDYDDQPSSFSTKNSDSARLHQQINLVSINRRHFGAVRGDSTRRVFIKESMASFSTSVNVKFEEGATFIFGSWLCTANQDGKLRHELRDVTIALRRELCGETMASPPPPARVTVRRSSRVSDSNTIFGSYPTRRSTWRQKPISLHLGVLEGITIDLAGAGEEEPGLESGQNSRFRAIFLFQEWTRNLREV
nr:unnamed protein product [Digitaria exilis]